MSSWCEWGLSCPVLDVRLRNLLFSLAAFVPCDHQLQRAHYVSHAVKVFSWYSKYLFGIYGCWLTATSLVEQTFFEDK